MVASDLINLIAGILVGGGTLTLAVMTWKSICQTRSIQKAERRERLLNEIIEWALDVAKPKYALNLISLTSSTSSIEDQSAALKIGWASHIDILIVRGDYIAKITLIFTKDLRIAVEKVRNGLEKHADLIKDLVDGKDTSKVLGIYDYELRRFADKVTEEAVKIRTRDIEQEKRNMPKEDEATGSNEPTLKDIEKHLRRQDKKLEDGTYFSGYLFGATLIFIAFGLLAGKYILTAELWYVTYCIILLIGGFGLTGFAWYKRSKTPK